MKALHMNTFDGNKPGRLCDGDLCDGLGQYIVAP